MALNDCYIFAVTDDLEQVLITDEVEPGKGSPLGLQVVTQSFLDIGQHLAQPLQSLLQRLYIHGLDEIGLGGHLLHQGRKLGVNTLKPRILVDQHILNIGGAQENALEVDPPPLHIDPDIQDDADLLQLVVPLHDLFLECLVVLGQLHAGQIVEVFVQLLEHVVPALYQVALALVSHELQLLGQPSLLHILEHLLQHIFASGNGHDFPKDRLVPIQISFPQLAKGDLALGHINPELAHQHLPMPRLHMFLLQVHNLLVHQVIASPRDINFLLHRLEGLV